MPHSSLFEGWATVWTNSFRVGLVSILFWATQSRLLTIDCPTSSLQDCTQGADTQIRAWFFIHPMPDLTQVGRAYFQVGTRNLWTFQSAWVVPLIKEQAIQPRSDALTLYEIGGDGTRYDAWPKWLRLSRNYWIKPNRIRCRSRRLSDSGEPRWLNLVATTGDDSSAKVPTVFKWFNAGAS